MVLWHYETKHSTQYYVHFNRVNDSTSDDNQRRNLRDAENYKELHE